MPRPQPLPVSLSDRGFTVADARAAGVPRGRLRSSDLEAPFRGIRCRSELLGDADARARAYAAKLRDGEALSHGTALVVVGVAVPSRCTADVHVTSFGGPQRARGQGVHGHEALPASLRVLRTNGLLVVHPVDAWCQLASTLSVRELVCVGDALLRRKRPIATIADLQDAVARWGRRRGARRLREALNLVRERTDSFQETELRLDAAAAGLPEPEVNGRITDESGRFVAFGDLVYRAHRTILEYDGEQHRLDDVQFARDISRLDDLARLGWRVIRVTKRHRGSERLARLARAREALAERGWHAS